MFNLMAKTECFTYFVICMSLKEKTVFFMVEITKKKQSRINSGDFYLQYHDLNFFSQKSTFQYKYFLFSCLIIIASCLVSGCYAKIYYFSHENST